jgi:hypothetical protein
LSERARRSNEILGANVLLTGWDAGRGTEVAFALEPLASAPVELAGLDLPFVALAKVSLERAEAARVALEAAGASVEIEDTWITRDGPSPTSRPPCPFCGSTKTQPYTHAGPAARKSMKCTACGQRFRL